MWIFGLETRPQEHGGSMAVELKKTYFPSPYENKRSITTTLDYRFAEKKGTRGFDRSGTLRDIQMLYFLIQGHQ